MTRGAMQKGSVGERAAAISPLQELAAAVFHSIAKICGNIKIRRKVHSLHLQETLTLGDRRFLAVVEWQKKTLLVGVTPQSITVLDTKIESSAAIQSNLTGQDA